MKKEDLRRLRRAEKLLSQARSAIFGELDAIGWDEVEKHPSLKPKSKLLDRIDRFLSSPPKGGRSSKS